ncbi:MAG TPA: hypothetical protein VN541_17845 [Tepidisphaeraceae bacterium]|nr:hypothetical protein [Tepidisphaeraceae bacterium]
MGYELHITRAESWADNDGKEITADEWLELVSADPELRLAGYNGPYFAIWSGPSEYPDPWLDWFGGNISSKHPDSLLIEKMAQIAAKLGAKVQGDDGELYVGADDLNRLMWSLQALAQPAEAQVALFPKSSKVASKLWLDLERSSEWFDADGRGPANGSAKAWETVSDLRSQLQLMRGAGNDRLWTDDALRNERKWEAIRKAARRALAAFGWAAELPPKGWSE